MVDVAVLLLLLFGIMIVRPGNVVPCGIRVAVVIIIVGVLGLYASRDVVNNNFQIILTKLVCKVNGKYPYTINKTIIIIF